MTMSLCPDGGMIKSRAALTEDLVVTTPVIDHVVARRPPPQTTALPAPVVMWSSAVVAVLDELGRSPGVRQKITSPMTGLCRRKWCWLVAAGGCRDTKDVANDERDESYHAAEHERLGRPPADDPCIAESRKILCAVPPLIWSLPTRPVEFVAVVSSGGDDVGHLSGPVLSPHCRRRRIRLLPHRRRCYRGRRRP